MMPTHIWSITVTAHSPLAFARSKPDGQFRESLPFVPGASLYGALGTQLANDTMFEADFFENLRCYNAYPSREGDEWVRPLPATAMRPKGYQPTKDATTPGFDTLVERVCWEQQEPAALIYAPTDADGRPWEASGRMFYTLEHSPGLPVKIVQRDVHQRVLTRVGINRRRGTAEEGLLYSPMVLSEAMDVEENHFEKTQFRGSIIFPGTQEKLDEGLQTIQHLGGRQSTGLGIVTVESTPATLETGTEVAQRIAQLTKRFVQQAAIFEHLGGTPWNLEHASIFTINLLSDALLLQHGWVPTNIFDETMLQEATGIEATLLRAFAGNTFVGGWNVQWQRPKPTAVATTMGSVFVFLAKNGLNNDEYEKLARLQIDGIGTRRAEGYGQIRVCDEFHVIHAKESR